MIKIVAMWITAISLLIIASYTVLSYNMDRAYFYSDGCSEEDVAWESWV